MPFPFPFPQRLCQSIAFRYLSIACGILVTTQVALGLIQARNHFRRGLMLLENKAEDQTRFLSTVSPEALLTMDFLALETLMRQTGRDRDFVYSVVLDRHDQPLTRFLDREHPLVRQAFQSQAISLENGGLTNQEIVEILDQIDQNPMVYGVEKPIVSGDTFLGKVILGYSSVNVQRELYEDAALTVLMAIAVSGLLATVTVVLFNRQVRTPLSQLATAAQQLTNGQLQERVTIDGVNHQDEVGRLKTAFNHMADQLQQNLEGLQERNKTLAFTNAELARATRLKDEFLANMSHELRTPLNVVLGLSQALMQEVYGPLTERQAVSLERILKSGQHLLSLINDILDLAKIEAGQEDLQIVSLSVSRLCHTCGDFVRHLAEDNQLTFIIHTDVNPDYVEGDERRLHQVLLNLLNNAIKFTPAGGKVILTAQSDRQEQLLRISVQDTGIGIAPQDMDKLFESFVQIDSNLSRRYEGTGLGLALVRRLVELHGGSIAVDSEVGQGSCFTIVLPWRHGRHQAPLEKGRISPTMSHLPESIEVAPSTPEVASPSDYLILIAEDNENNVVMLADYLSFKGYQLAFAKNGLEAVSLAKETKPQLILMDIHLPRMDGLEATRWIRSDQELAAIPIIALTALAMPGDREKCQAAGMNDYITKPVNLEHLMQTIYDLLSVQKSPAPSS